jgi:hypothetical protein
VTEYPIVFYEDYWHNVDTFGHDTLVLSQFNSIGFIGTWETYVNIAKASEVDTIQKWNKQ